MTSFGIHILDILLVVTATAAIAFAVGAALMGLG